MLDQLFISAPSALRRGNWKSGAALVVAQGDCEQSNQKLVDVACTLSAAHLKALLFFLKRPAHMPELVRAVHSIVLQDFDAACDMKRPSSLRLFLHSLFASRPAFAITDSREACDALRSVEIGTYLVGGRQSVARRSGARRSLPLPSKNGHVGAFANHVIKLATRDFDVARSVCSLQGSRDARSTKRIIIPCSDWHLSGVNTALAAAGEELRHRGWDVRIVFTRPRDAVIRSAGSADLLPSIPYSFIAPPLPGHVGLWEALMAHLESAAPCVMLTAYDFIGNGVIPALSDKVGVVSWLQSDDADYYEQAYRLGRYCNALVCVSQRIRDEVAALNPSIGQHATVVHNSSVYAREVSPPRRPSRRRTIRLIYTGRLVQYQKRVLDFIQLAQGLDAEGVGYQITLAGEFAHSENIADRFRKAAAAHLGDGRIRLVGRLSRDQVGQALSEHDGFLLLSDFEGLPLSLVEAMSRGCVPVVAQMRSGIDEVIASGKSGLVVEGRDYKQWARRIVALWQDRPRWAAMANRAIETIRAGFTVERVATQLGEVFEQVARDVCRGTYHRPPSLNWGERSTTGDVLPPPTLYRPSF
jgi:glycosyltransferase involved in cell wall biosynthesis